MGFFQGGVAGDENVWWSQQERAGLKEQLVNQSWQSVLSVAGTHTQSDVWDDPLGGKPHLPKPTGRAPHSHPQSPTPPPPASMFVNMAGRQRPTWPRWTQESLGYCIEYIVHVCHSGDFEDFKMK